MTGLRKPELARLGADVAGQVAAVGRKVTRFKPGDEVFGSCRGAFAEYARTSESAVVIKPDNVTFEEAASAPVVALTALQGLRDKGKIQAGQKVLINGAAGGVGTFAVQIARSFGADVTGVCSTRNVEMVRSIGANQVIDYTRKNFTENGQRYDIIFDCVGNHSLSAFRRILNPNGKYVAVGGSTDRWMIDALARAIRMIVLSIFSGRKLTTLLARSTVEDLTKTGELMKTGSLKPVIDRRYPLNEVPEAIRYLEEGHARGKVIIALGDSNNAG
jgi:NADPH:quinone reductase-like Zn-dependent oxidoreductase